MGHLLTVLFGKSSFGVEHLFGNQGANGSETCRILLVHGLHGGMKTFGNTPKYLGEQLGNVSVYQFNYASGIKRYFPYASKSPKDDAIVLADYLRDNPYDGNYILYGFSEGGIIIAMALKRLHERGDTTTLKKIIGQFLSNSPMAGAGLAFLFKDIGYIKKDAQVLAFGNDVLRELSEYFQRNFDLNEQRNHANKCHIPTWAVITTGDQYVSQFSSSFGIPLPQVKLVYGDHSSPVNPKSDSDDALGYIIHKINWLLEQNFKKEKNIVDSGLSNVPLRYRYDVKSTLGIEELVEACKATHQRGDYDNYYKMLSEFSLPLKKKGRHKELSEICELDIYRRKADNPYPILTYSQCKLVTYSLREAFDALTRWIENDRKLTSVSPLIRLRVVGTYCEILNADGAYDLAADIMQLILSHRSTERVHFKTLCQSFGTLARSYLGKGDLLSAIYLCEATLFEQKLTADMYSIPIAEMNLGIVYLAANNLNAAQDLFESALEKFKGLDDRALAWAQLNLSVTRMKAGRTEEVEELISAALAYYSSHLECSHEYLSRLEYITTAGSVGAIIGEKCTQEYTRISNEIAKNGLSKEQLQSAEKAKSIFALSASGSESSWVHGKAVTKGMFKVRSTIVKSFRDSLDIDSAAKYLETIKSRTNHFSVPICNFLLAEVCQKRKELIQSEIIDKIGEILTQTDSIKLFFANFLETEELDVQCEILLDDIKNKNSHKYLNIRANLYSHSGRNYVQAFEHYKQALQATRVEKKRAKVYNNLAHLIYKYRRRTDYEIAIGYCRESIKLRSTSRFWYPAVLMLILKIELANQGEISNIIAKHRIEFDLKYYEVKHLLENLHDNSKRKFVESILAKK